MMMAAVTDDAWRTTSFRQNMVSKIEEAILQCGSPTTKNAVEMEGQVFSKAKTKDEYLGFVARLIIHIKEMGKNKAGAGTAANAAQGSQGQAPGGQMMGGQNNLQMMNQMNPMSNSMGMGPGMNPLMGQQSNYGVNTQTNQMSAGLGQGQPQMMQGIPQMQQLQQQQLQQQQLQQLQPQNSQQQILNQQNSFLQQQQHQLQNPLLHNQQGPNPQLQGHHMQGMMSSPSQQQPMMVGRGMQNQQLMGNRMMAPQPNMANQLTRMAQQRNQVDGVLLPNYGPGGGQMQRTPQSQFMSPNPSQQMGMGASPSPGSMGGGSGPAPPYGSSPGSAGMIHSPAGSALRPYMVPSPGSSLNTPMMVAPTPSPRNSEDQACLEKIKELRKYTDLLQKMLAKVGNDDVEKSSKMKKLLDILTNPRSSVSMDLLIKCEAALKKMERTDAGGVPQQTPGKDQTSPFTQFFESVQTMTKFPSAGHTWKRTVHPAMDAFFGHAFLFEDMKTEDESEESDDDSSIPWVLNKELKLLNSLKFKVKLGGETGKLICTLVDHHLPTIPPLKIHVTAEYPDQSPRTVGMTKDYGSTPLLRSIAQGLKSRMLNLSEKFTVTEMLINWAMSVRQARNENITKLSRKLKQSSRNEFHQPRLSRN